VPWCEPCHRFFTPTGLTADGSCPACGHQVADPEGQEDQGERDDDGVRVPWHFWVVLGAAALYLGWRLLQGVGWLVDLF
jgi:hypothetical protein